MINAYAHAQSSLRDLVTVSFFLINGKHTGTLNHCLFSKSIDLKNESKITMDLAGRVPWLHYVGQYDMDGKILVVPVKGNGDFYMNFSKQFI